MTTRTRGRCKSRRGTASLGGTVAETCRVYPLKEKYRRVGEYSRLPGGTVQASDPPAARRPRAGQERPPRAVPRERAGAGRRREDADKANPAGRRHPDRRARGRPHPRRAPPGVRSCSRERPPPPAAGPHRDAGAGPGPSKMGTQRGPGLGGTKMGAVTRRSGRGCDPGGEGKRT